MQRDQLEHLIRAAGAISGDHEFCRAVVGARLVEQATLRQRLDSMDIPKGARERMAHRIDADFDF